MSVRSLAAITATLCVVVATCERICLADESANVDPFLYAADETVVAQGDPNGAPCFMYDPAAAGMASTPTPDLWTRPTLTNGFGGLQSQLAAKGIVYSAFYTNFYQGAASGGAQQDFVYGGKLDQFVILDGEKLGLWKGFSVSMHAETRAGQDDNQKAVGFAPVNANMLYPSTAQSTAITGFLLTQALSEEWLVSAGKYNLLDLFNQIYPQTGRGIDGFMNASMLLPLSAGLGLNLSVMGAGVTKLNQGRVQGAFSVVDPQNVTTTSGFNNLFGNGSTLLGYWRLFSEFRGLPGSHALMAVYSNSKFTNVDQESWIFIPGQKLVPGSKTGTWNVEYFFEQKLWVDSCNAQRNVGLLSMWGISDGNPNPISWSANVGLQGQGLVASRPQDTMGVGYFYTGLSGDFRRLVSPIIQLQDVTGGELYYNAAITPWFHLTTDLQVIQPANKANDTAIVFGLRGKISI